MDRIEIYLRHSGDRALLMFHVPNRLRTKFLQAIQNGVVDSKEMPLAFETPVLSKWDAEKEIPTHMRTEIDQITIQYD